VRALQRTIQNRAASWGPERGLTCTYVVVQNLKTLGTCGSASHLYAPQSVVPASASWSNLRVPSTLSPVSQHHVVEASPHILNPCTCRNLSSALPHAPPLYPSTRHFPSRFFSTVLSNLRFPIGLHGQNNLRHFPFAPFRTPSSALLQPFASETKGINSSRIALRNSPLYSSPTWSGQLHLSLHFVSVFWQPARLS
jgi:hypothetical protein